MIQKNQIKRIYAQARELNIDSGVLDDFVFKHTGKEHISKLTDLQAKKVILELTKLTGKKSMPGRLSASQEAYIKHLAFELGWGDDFSRLRGFIKKFTGVEEIKWLKPRQASSIIEGMKSMLARMETKEERVQ